MSRLPRESAGYRANRAPMSRESCAVAFRKPDQVAVSPYVRHLSCLATRGSAVTYQME